MEERENEVLVNSYGSVTKKYNLISSLTHEHPFHDLEGGKCFRVNQFAMPLASNSCEIELIPAICE